MSGLLAARALDPRLGRRHRGRAAARAARRAPARRAASRPRPARRGFASAAPAGGGPARRCEGRKAVEHSLSPPSIGRPATVAERAERKRQPAAGLAPRRVDEAQVVVREQQAGGRRSRAAAARTADAASPPSPRARRAASGSTPRLSMRTRKLPAAYRIASTAQVGASVVSRSRQADATIRRAAAGPPGAPATCAAPQPRIASKNAHGSASDRASPSGR